MAKYVLEYAGKQYRSEKAEKFATALALQLREYSPRDLSTYKLIRYYTIDGLKAAVSAVRRGDTLEVDQPSSW